MIFLIPLLGLISSFVFGFNAATTEKQSEVVTNVHSFEQVKSFATVKIVGEEENDDSKIIIDESESEIDLEFDWVQNASFGYKFLKLSENGKTFSSEYDFLVFHYKIPLYKLFCKWKFHLS